ncbi:MAG: DsbA family protein [Rhizobiaceae bacterium]|nr:DsbA family protein [Rhizobiaceae bacterium]
MPPVKIQYFSDVLCIWAYIAQVRIEKLSAEFGEKIAIENHFCSVFPDSWTKIENNWGAKGGFAGFNKHLIEVSEKFPHIEVSERIWLDAKPRTSASPHLFLKAVELIEHSQSGDSAIPYLERLSIRAAAQVRKAFFKSSLDISSWQEQSRIAEELGIDTDLVSEKIRSPQAFALLAADYDLAQKKSIEGSPTFIMNNGRQKLFGNVGYRLLEANVQELLRNPPLDEASWC